MSLWEGFKVCLQLLL